MCCQSVTEPKSKKCVSGIDPISFYGPSVPLEFSDAYNCILPPEVCRKFRDIRGPSTIWRNFRKQQQVLDFVSSMNCDLFPFTYQVDNGDRLFLAAHPITYWYMDEQKPLNIRHGYEIIREFVPCKLYFDLEFDLTANCNQNGYQMVNVFISIVGAALKHEYNVVCDEKDVLNLESSSASKFSCHLIFPGVIFENNYAAGFFVKQLCHELKLFSGNVDRHLLKNANVNESMVAALFVANNKDQRVLFCDEGVYTKNRHFRLYKSSKYGKNIPLRLSEMNAFPIPETDSEMREETIFLNSLITYCDIPKSQVLSFQPTLPMVPKLHLKSRSINNEVVSSPYVEIDKCINELIAPGRIHKSTFFPKNKIVVYDIIGNRYCQNIGREHKSNNVKYVVDIGSFTYYQKCYDPDCSEFKSEKQKLPLDEGVFVKYDIDDGLFIAAVEQYETSVSPSGAIFSVTENKNNFHTVVGGVNHANQSKIKSDEAYEEEILAAVAEQCELSACLFDDWNPVS